ncbi:uncharacterized protein LOC17886214 isoform X2 [Capsella rubella]|uniref:uncharacterized protein LOC17886214 isoform X2 n=1 Tax=Capsella rubella TaxID=81985 RepID=UPI000CD4CA71|nr:uncharacterized protein LOC17886214 isoform X2 [Capsella rubella]
MATMEESDNAKALKKAYADMILNTAKESSARVMVSDRRTARFHYDLCGTKDEALRLLVRLKQMIAAKTIEAEITSSNQQTKIDVLEVQLQEAEDIITDLRSELRWVRDKLKKAKNVVNKEQETISAQKIADLEVVVGSVHPNKDISGSLPNQISLHDDECGGNGTVSAPQVIFDRLCVETLKACESGLDANIRSQKLELSRTGCTQRIHALETKTSSANEEERHTADKDSEKNLSSGHETGTRANTRCLVLALRARNAEVIPIKPSNSLGIKKSYKLQGRKKTRWSKRKATLGRSQSQLIKPCKSQCDIPCSKTSVENSDCEDSLDTDLSVDNEEVDALNSCKGFDEHLHVNDISIICKGKRSNNVDHWGGLSSPVNPTDHLVEAYHESNVVSVSVEDGESKAHIPKNETKMKPLPCLDPGLTSFKCNVDPTSGSTNATVVSVNATNSSTDKDLKSREEDVLVRCEGEKNSVVPTTKMGSELVNPRSDLKATAVISDQISESRKADRNHLVKYTFQRKRKRNL